MATFSCEPSRDWPSNGPATWDATHKSLHLLRVDVKECSYSNYGPDQWQDAISPFSSQSLSQSLSSRESENGYGEDGGDTPSSLRGSVSDLSDDVLSTSAYDTSCESHPGSFMGSGSPLEEVLKLPNIVRTDRRPRKSWQQNGKAGESTYTNQPKLIQLPPSRTPIFQEAGLHDHTCLFKSIKLLHLPREIQHLTQLTDHPQHHAWMNGIEAHLISGWARERECGHAGNTNFCPKRVHHVHAVLRPGDILSADEISSPKTTGQSEKGSQIALHDDKTSKRSPETQLAWTQADIAAHAVIQANRGTRSHSALPKEDLNSTYNDKDFRLGLPPSCIDKQHNYISESIDKAHNAKRPSLFLQHSPNKTTPISESKVPEKLLCSTQITAIDFSEDKNTAKGFSAEDEAQNKCFCPQIEGLHQQCVKSRCFDKPPETSMPPPSQTVQPQLEKDTGEQTRENVSPLPSHFHQPKGNFVDRQRQCIDAGEHDLEPNVREPLQASVDPFKIGNGEVKQSQSKGNVMSSKVMKRDASTATYQGARPQMYRRPREPNMQSLVYQHPKGNANEQNFAQDMHEEQIKENVDLLRSGQAEAQKQNRDLHAARALCTQSPGIAGQAEGHIYGPKSLAQDQEGQGFMAQLCPEACFPQSRYRLLSMDELPLKEATRTTQITKQNDEAFHSPGLKHHKLSKLQKQRGRRFRAFRDGFPTQTRHKSVGQQKHLTVGKQFNMIQKPRVQGSSFLRNLRRSWKHGRAQHRQLAGSLEFTGNEDLLRNRPEHQFELEDIIRESMGKPGWHSNPLRASTFAAFSSFDHLRHVQMSQGQKGTAKQSRLDRPDWDSTPYFSKRRPRSTLPGPQKKQLSVPRFNTKASQQAHDIRPRKEWDSSVNIPPPPKEKRLFVVERHKPQNVAALSTDRHGSATPATSRRPPGRLASPVDQARQSPKSLNGQARYGQSKNKPSSKPLQEGEGAISQVKPGPLSAWKENLKPDNRKFDIDSGLNSCKKAVTSILEGQLQVERSGGVSKDARPQEKVADALRLARKRLQNIKAQLS